MTPPGPRARTALLSLGAGLAAALAHPPLGMLPGLLGYALLVWLLDHAVADRPLKSAFWRAWLAGTAYFAVGTWWVTEAFMVDAANQGWMAPFALIFLSGGLGAIWGAAGLLYRAARPRGLSRVLVFAGALSLAEWFRGVGGFPWNLPGETWRAGSPISQAASLVGAYGLTWITLAVAASPVLLVDKAESRRGVIAAGMAAAVLAGLYGWGSMRLDGAVRDAPGQPTVRVVQANVEQAAKYDMAYFRDIVGRYVSLTARPAAKTPDIVLWPEGALPAPVAEYLADGTWTREAIAGALKPGQTLILGGFHIEGTDERPIFRNSLFVVRRGDEGLQLTGLYDKHRLVPFGEFLPFEELMGRIGVKQLVHVGDGFTPGARPHPIASPGVPALLPLICYESLFPQFGDRSGSLPAKWIVNISNDAWFGRTSGPWQHLNLASYRAIEEGLPMVRATPTGVSAVVDAYGRVRPNARLELGRFGVIDATLPMALSKTPFMIIGNLAFWLLIVLSLSLAVRQIVQSVKS